MCVAHITFVIVCRACEPARAYIGLDGGEGVRRHLVSNGVSRGPERGRWRTSAMSRPSLLSAALVAEGETGRESESEGGFDVVHEKLRSRIER